MCGDCHLQFAHVVVVDTDNLGLFGAAETEEGDKVHDPEDGGGDHKRPSHTGDSLHISIVFAFFGSGASEQVRDAHLCELVAQLHPVAVPPLRKLLCMHGIARDEGEKKRQERKVERPEKGKSWSGCRICGNGFQIFGMLKLTLTIHRQ